MIRRVTVRWPTELGAPDGRRFVHLLAVSDEPAASLGDARNRAAIEPIDAVLGCGDLEPDYLDFLADAFHAPLLFVRGNHDRGGAWDAGRRLVPVALSGRLERVAGLDFAGLSWPSFGRERAEHSEMSAATQALRLYLLAVTHRRRPDIMLSHVPPRAAGDIPNDPYHTGFAGYRWLCRRLRPALWLHGHTTVAAAEHWRSSLGSTTLINVTGATLIRLEAPVPGRGTIAAPSTPQPRGTTVADSEDMEDRALKVDFAETPRNTAGTLAE